MSEHQTLTPDDLIQWMRRLINACSLMLCVCACSTFIKLHIKRKRYIHRCIRNGYITSHKFSIFSELKVKLWAWIWNVSVVACVSTCYPFRPYAWTFWRIYSYSHTDTQYKWLCSWTARAKRVRYTHINTGTLPIPIKNIFSHLICRWARIQMFNSFNWLSPFISSLHYWQITDT